MSLKRCRGPDDPPEQHPRPDGPRPPQAISNISTTNGSTAFVGVFNGPIQHPNTEGPRDAFQKKVDDCRDVLLLTDPDDDRAGLISTKGKRSAGTCEWIRNNDTYRSWLSGGTQLLWISGGPGKGKTVLSIFLTEEFERLCQDSGNATLLFYFCNHQDERRNSAMTILRGLIYQLLTKRPNLATHVLPLLRGRNNTQNTLASVHALWRIFHSILRDPGLGTVYCVIDGLDECDDESSRPLVQYLTDLFSPGFSQPTNMMFKLAIVSRPEIVELNDFPQIRLDPDNDRYVSNDIELFVSARVEKLSRNIKGLDNDFRTYVHDVLLDRADGTFLWAGFVIDELFKKRTCTEIEETLETIPKGLHAIFDRMMRQIKSNRRQKAVLIFRWVTFAARPLTLRELAVAAGIQSSPLITAEQATRDEVDLCGPFLKVHKNEVNFVHQSAKEYLSQMAPDDHPEFYINSGKAHLQLTRTCLDLIEKIPPHNERDGDIILFKFPLLEYASECWPYHASYASNDIIELLHKSRSLVAKEFTMRRLWGAYFAITSLFKTGNNSLLVMASYYNIIPWVEQLSNKSPTEVKADAIMAAAIAGGITVIQLLLSRGADINARNSDGETALSLAARMGKTATVQLLLDRGADINARNSYGETASISTASMGQTATVQLLLDRGADINACSSDGETALLLAARMGEITTVQLLLDRGADINVCERYGETALISAASRGKTAVVQLLLDRGADINACSRDGETALTSAAMMGQITTVQLLLDRGADNNACNSIGGLGIVLTYLPCPNCEQEAGNSSMQE